LLFTTTHTKDFSCTKAFFLNDRGIAKGFDFLFFLFEKVPHDADLATTHRRTLLLPEAIPTPDTQRSDKLPKFRALLALHPLSAHQSTRLLSHAHDSDDIGDRCFDRSCGAVISDRKK
jgi:hypothetical protein